MPRSITCLYVYPSTSLAKNGRVIYPNVERTLRVLSNLTAHFSKPEYKQVVVAIELVNEAFISIPIEVVKDFYLRVSQGMQCSMHDVIRYVCVCGGWDMQHHVMLMLMPCHIYQGYQVVRSHNDHLAVIIGDSFRFGAW